LLLLAALTASATLVAQDASRARLESALDDWHAGRYPEALGELRALLEGTDGDAFVEPVALLTGEFYRSAELSPSDRLVVDLTGAAAPKWSPDGRHFSFESTAGARRTIHLYRMEKGAPQALEAIDGFSATFSFDGSRVAFLRILEDQELRAARSAGTKGSADGQAAGRAGGPSLADLEAARTFVFVRSLATGSETRLDQPERVTKMSVHYADDNQLFVTGGVIGGPPGSTQVHRVTASAEPAVTTGAASARVVQALAGGRLLVSVGPNAFGSVEPGRADVRTFNASAYSASAGGDTIAFLTRANNESVIQVASVATQTAPVVVKTASVPIANPVVSPDGRRVAFQMMPHEDWELYVIDVDSKVERRITNEIQHDHTPRFLTNDRLLAVMGENRHRRSYVYDLATGRRTRLFHNNTLRTLSMEHAWSASPDGQQVIVVADRDGDTISPERGVYLMDLASTVSKRDVVARLDRELAAENDLRGRGRRMFEPIAGQVRGVVGEASIRRIYEYERALTAFGSKYVTEPGNKLAAEYIHATLTSFGYAPEYQYFDAPAGRGQPPVRTANVIATLRGTVHPELEYLVSSHFDSVREGPGSDDNTSGTAALLETARILRSRPMPATIKFIWFTGEEAGLLGSREYVRQAVARGDKVVGALNNDMVGFADDGRLDDTIRYSNPGLRDLQHAAAFLFTNLVTYDSHYYRGTDALSFFDAYGDIFSGIGSYPILGNPHYHQAHDTLDTVSFPLITEVARATTASIMLMASSPSRLRDLTAAVKGGGAEIAWGPSSEKDVSGYLVRSWVNGKPSEMRVAAPRANVPGLRAGDTVWVKAVNKRGLEGWDWRREVVK
jgi:hypothetical protein